jgi:DNA ligase-4
LKLEISEKTVFSVFHPDAEDLFNVTCDLKLVCEKLCDRNQPYKRQVKTLNPKSEHMFVLSSQVSTISFYCSAHRDSPWWQDIEVGKAVRPQLAARVGNVEEAWKKVVLASTFMLMMSEASSYASSATQSAS